jgi:hypothetical protein
LSYDLDVDQDSDQVISFVVKKQSEPNVIVSASSNVISNQRNVNENENESTNQTLIQLVQQNQIQQRQLLDAVQLPAAQLFSFDGNPLNFYMFMRTFEANFERSTVDNSSRLARLIQYCTGRAKQVIMCCTVMQPDEGYIKAKTLLRQRFGDSYVIADAWMNKITSGPAIKSSDNDALQCLADDLCNCFETLKAMKGLCEVNSQKTLARVVERLPSYLQFRWRREAREIRKKRKDEEGDPSLEDLMLLVSDAAAEANDPVFKLSSNSSNESRRATHTSTNRQAGAVFSTTSAKVVQPGDNSRAQREDPSWFRPCVFCNESHSPFSCHLFKG